MASNKTINDSIENLEKAKQRLDSNVTKKYIDKTLDVLKDFEQKQLDAGTANIDSIMEARDKAHERKIKAFYTRDKRNKLREECAKLNNYKPVKLAKPYLIGINGEIGCGKTTAVDYLSANYGFNEYMFAEPLKRIAVLLGFKEKEVFGTQEEQLAINEFWGISGRRFLQVFGSEVCRDFVPKALNDMNFNGLTLWVRLFEKYYMENNNTAVAVSDVRFEDESNTVKRLGGYVVRIERSAGSDTDSKVNDQVDQHVSETQKDKIKPQIIIRNNGSITDLYKKLDQLVVLLNQGFPEVTSTIIYM
jgi:hypothetical protein